MGCNVTAVNHVVKSGGASVAHSPTERPLIRVPAIIRFPGPIINRLLGLGMRIGPNWLLTRTRPQEWGAANPATGRG